jgi:hypothetical protein
MVQGSHALAQYSLEYPVEFQKWHNTTIVFLGVRNLVELKAWHIELLKKRISSSFFEPDLDSQITAIACWDDGRIFSDLNSV